MNRDNEVLTKIGNDFRQKKTSIQKLKLKMEKKYKFGSDTSKLKQFVFKSEL